MKGFNEEEQSFKQFLYNTLEELEKLAIFFQVAVHFHPSHPQLK